MDTGNSNNSFKGIVLGGFLLLVTPVFFSCSTLGLTNSLAGTSKTSFGGFDGIQDTSQPFYVLQDGEFVEASLTKEPELIGGKDLMETLIKLNIRYPDVAKEKKIGGTVLISVVIDELGQMEDAFVHEGIGGGCNDEALRAVKIMNRVGFEPGEMNGVPVTVRFDIPITFLPQ